MDAEGGIGGASLTVRVGQRRLALPAAEVEEVVRLKKVTRVPHAPPCLAGVANLRGIVVPVVSLARLLDEAEDAAGASSRIVLLDRGGSLLGLQVDAVASLGSAEEAGTIRRLDLDRLLDAAFGTLMRRVAGETAAAAAVVIQAPAERQVGLLRFTVAGQDYALPLEHVDEVMALPASIAPLPHRDAAALGVALLRGSLLPLISLGALLGLAGSAEKPRVIVVRLGTARIGLVVDRLASILSAAESAIGPVPSVLNRGAGEGQIDAMLRAADGRGLVSILSPERLFRDETVARILADGSQQEAGGMAEQHDAETERFVIFRLGDETYGMPIGVVDEVVRLKEPITRLPRAPEFVEGVMNLRGKVIPLIDQRRRFEVPGERPGGRRVLVAQVRGLQAGFIVDAVSRVVDLPRTSLYVTPDLSGEGSRLFDRVAHIEADGGMILLIDPEALLDRVEADILSAMAETDQAVPAR